MLSNTYRYVSNFAKLLNVAFYHNYYEDNLLKEIGFFLDNETKMLFKSYGLQFRLLDNGFVILRSLDEKYNSPSYKGILNLKVYFRFTNDLFLNITDIEYSNDMEFKFENEQDKTEEKLHKNLFVDASNINFKETNGIIGEISLNLNLQDQFFGYEEKVNLPQELNYSIHFNSRKVKFRYNFYATKEITDADNYYITDDQETFKISQPKLRILASGKSVYSFLMNDEIILSEKYSRKLYLKKEDDFLTYF